MTRLLATRAADGTLRALVTSDGRLADDRCIGECCDDLPCPCYLEVRLCPDQVIVPGDCVAQTQPNLYLIPCDLECPAGGLVVPAEAEDVDEVYRLVKIGGLCYEVTQLRYYSPTCAGNRRTWSGPVTILDQIALGQTEFECFAPGTTCEDGDCEGVVGYIWGELCEGSNGDRQRWPYICSSDLPACLMVRVEYRDDEGGATRYDCYSLDPAAEQRPSPPPGGVLITPGSTPDDIDTLDGDCCRCLGPSGRCDFETQTYESCANTSVVECCCEGLYEWEPVFYLWRVDNTNEDGIRTVTEVRQGTEDDIGQQCVDFFPNQAIQYVETFRSFAPDGTQTGGFAFCTTGPQPVQQCLPPVGIVVYTPSENQETNCGPVIGPPFDITRSSSASATCSAAGFWSQEIRVGTNPGLGGLRSRRITTQRIQWRRRTLVPASGECSGGCQSGQPFAPGPTPFDPPTGPQTAAAFVLGAI